MRPSPARFPVLPRPSRRAVLALLAAVLAGLVVHRVTADAAATSEALGRTTTVWVATTDLGVGAVIDDDAVRAVERPVAHVPAGPAPEPLGATVRDAIVAGEIVLAARLGTGDRRGPAALVPAGWRAVAIPTGDGVLPVAVGDMVDVVAAFDPGLGSPEPATVVVADAVVVHVDGDFTATVAIPRNRVPAVAFSLVTGYVTLALVP